MLIVWRNGSISFKHCCRHHGLSPCKHINDFAFDGWDISSVSLTCTKMKTQNRFRVILENLRIGGIVCCTDCEAFRGKFVIFLVFKKWV